MCSLCAQTASAVPEAGPAPGPSSSRETALLVAINDYRAAHHLNRWRAEPGLAAIARGHSHAMASRRRLSHEGFTQRAARTGSSVCVENLLQGAVTPTQAVAAWLQSEQHRANLLDRDAAWAGIGVAGSFVTVLACATPALATVDRRPP